MFCPSCRSEYREGFTRCASCEVELVGDLDAHERSVQAERKGVVKLGVLVDYCGFLSLDEARASRDRLKANRVPSEITIRDHVAGNFDALVEEEYWLRVPSKAFDAAREVLGYDEHEADDDEAICSGCGGTLEGAASSCPHCGMRFDAP